MREVWISGYRSYAERPCDDPPDKDTDEDGAVDAWGRRRHGRSCVCVQHGERMVAGFCANWAPDMDAIYETHHGPGRNGNFLLAEYDGAIIGCVGAVPHDRLTCELHRMSVSGRSHVSSQEIPRRPCHDAHGADQGRAQRRRGPSHKLGTRWV